MRLHSLTKLLFTLSLIAFISACKKEDEVVPNSKSGELTCVAEGVRISSKAWASYTPASVSLDTYDLLTITALTPSKEYFIVYYAKPADSNESAFAPVMIRYETGPIATNSTIVYNTVVGSVKKTAKGWSGTFSGKVYDNSTGTTGIVTSGLFTDVKE